MKLLVVSDFHLGRGPFLKNGQRNILEDFHEDERFIEFLEYYSSGSFYLKKIHLILNGDICNLIQIDNEGVFSHIVDEEWSIKALDAIMFGHRNFFQALQDFLHKPNKKITYIIGNHDSGMAFEGVQKRFKEILNGDIEFCFEFNFGAVRIEHGHRFEVNNAIPLKHYFLPGPNGKKILNLPWGSLFCISLLPQLKKRRPYIDRVRPISIYIRWCFFNEPKFFFKLLYRVLKYFIVTSFATYTKQNANFKTTIKLLKQITIYPKFSEKARSILKNNDNVSIMVIGHTHIMEWRKFPERKYYFNTGTWNAIPSMDAALYENVTKLSYVLIDIQSKTKVIREASVKIWQGKWQPFRDEVTTSPQL